MESRKVHLFLDMDGTLAKFYEHADCLERMFTPGFFRDLNGYENVIEGLRILTSKFPNNMHVYALSAVNREAQEATIKEKKQWLKKHCPFIHDNHYIFTEYGENKAEAVKAVLATFAQRGAIRPCDILIDDYNKNLDEWNEAGGYAIKMVNEINDKGTRGSLWAGPRIRYDFAPERICDEIASMITALTKQGKERKV